MDKSSDSTRAKSINFSKNLNIFQTVKTLSPPNHTPEKFGGAFVKTYLSLLAAFLCTSAFALSVNHAEYNREESVVELYITYCYDEVEPTIDLIQNSCLETFPQQCSINVVVSGEELRPEDSPGTCVLSWLNYEVEEQTKPAYLTFRGNDDSEVRIFVD